jgi:NAD(P)-dependent dehydrogenase (short-subunit alcohol dehydrogenase family)
VLARRVDVAEPEEMRAFAEAVHGEVAAVDLLVNNAGVGLGGLFLDTPLEDWEWIVRINLLGVVHGCHFFLPWMVERGRGGHVVNVASMSGYLCLPAQSAYAATKFAVLGLSEGLRAELGPFGIGVTAVCPGFIDTPIVESSRLRGVAADPANRARAIAFYRRRSYGPERVARRLLAAVQRNRAVAPVSAEAWVAYAGMRLTPGVLRWAMGRIARRALRGASPAAKEG